MLGGGWGEIHLNYGATGGGAHLIDLDYSKVLDPEVKKNNKYEARA